MVIGWRILVGRPFTRGVAYRMVSQGMATGP